MNNVELAWALGSYYAVVTVLIFLNLRHKWAGALAALMLAAPVMFMFAALYDMFGPNLLAWPTSSPFFDGFTLVGFVGYVVHVAVLMWSVTVPIRLLAAGCAILGRRGKKTDPPPDAPMEQRPLGGEHDEPLGNTPEAYRSCDLAQR